ncbi:MAG: hypothetical protein PHV07_06960 [Oscillospiraceae bacterium]|nr:hypothetical protein [Oscillospiraceae bacterium]
MTNRNNHDETMAGPSPNFPGFSVHGSVANPATLNLYNYCASNPVFYSDPSEHWFETVLDIISLADSAYTMWKDPSLVNGLFLLVDTVAVVIPVVPGTWAVKGTKSLGKVDEIIDGARRIFDNAIDGVRRLFSKADDTVELIMDFNRARKYIEEAESVTEEIVSNSKQIYKTVTDAVSSTSQAAKRAAEAAEKHRQIVQKTKNVVNELTQKYSKNLEDANVNRYSRCYGICYFAWYLYAGYKKATSWICNYKIS